MLLSKSSERFLRYFTKKFSKLTIMCFVFVRNNLYKEDVFKGYFK